MLPPIACNLRRADTTKEPGSLNQIITSRFPVFKVYLLDFKECHPRCVGELDRWEGSQKHNSYLI